MLATTSFPLLPAPGCRRAGPLPALDPGAALTPARSFERAAAQAPQQVPKQLPQHVPQSAPQQVPQRALVAALLACTLAIPVSAHAQAQSPAPAQVQAQALAQAQAQAQVPVPVPDPSSSPAGAQHWTLPSQPLGSALARIASESGQQISVDADLVRGLAAPPVQGQLTAEQAARAALAGSGLELVRDGAGHWSLRRAPVPPPASAVRAPSSALSTLPTVNVTSQAERSALSDGTGAYTVQAATVGGRLGESLREVPRSISVITRQQLDDQRMLNFNDAVQQLPGVTTTFLSGNDEETAYYARGNRLDSITVDGLSIATRSLTDGDSRGGGNNTGMAKYDSIQLLRGPDALFSGNGAPSGSINLIRKHPTDGLQARVALSAGSWDNYAVELDLSTPVTADGRVRSRFVVARNESRHFYRSTGSDKTTFYGIVDVDLTPATLLSVSASRDTLHGAPDQPPDFPRYSTGEPLNISRRAGYPDWVQRSYDVNNVMATLEHRFHPDWRVKAGVSSTRTRRGINQMPFYGDAADPSTDTTTGGVGASRADWHRDVTAVDVHVAGRFNALQREHQVMLGTDYNEAEQYSQIGGLASNHPIRNQSIYWPDFDSATVIPPWQNSPGWDNVTRQRQHGLYTYGRFQLQGPVKLILGGRYASFSATGTGWNAFPDPATGQCPTWATTCNAPSMRRYQNSNGIFTPYYALTWDVLPQWTGYVSMSRSFEDQSDSLDSNLQPLGPTRGQSWELGVKGSPFDGRLNTSLAFYRSVRDNYAVRVGRNDEFTPAGRSCCFDGSGEFLSQGIELEVSGALTPNWQINAGYSFDDNKTEYGDDQGKRYASYTPRHILRLWTSYRLPAAASAWRVGGGVQAQSGFFNSGTVGTWNPATGRFDGPSVAYEFNEPGRAVWNAFSEYRINRHWKAALNVNNVFDKRYYAVVGTTIGGNYFGPPRSVMLTVRGEM